MRDDDTTRATPDRALSFAGYLDARGFDLRQTLAFWRRMFLTPFVQPGFHKFWRLWNPLFGYATYRIYVALGGRRRRLLASAVAFTACGFVAHDLPKMIATRRVHCATTFAFLLFWLLASVSHALEPMLRQQRWPAYANVLLNLACLAAGVELGALLAKAL